MNYWLRGTTYALIFSCKVLRWGTLWGMVEYGQLGSWCCWLGVGFTMLAEVYFWLFLDGK